MNIHQFDSTSAAYDACQCDAAVSDGDILVIESEEVVGFADTWPIAVTAKAGNLHSKRHELTWEQVAAKAGVDYTKVLCALAYAKGRGWEVVA